MNKDTILEMLSSDSECLSLQEVYNILNEELEKSPEEMDTDLIELCIDAIDSANSEKVNNKRVKLRIRKALIAAVIFVIVIAISIPVCAKYFNVNVPNGIVEFYGDCFNIDISNDEYVDDILAELEKNGIENALLPDLFFKNYTLIYELDNSANDGNTTICFKFKSNDINGGITIKEYNDSFDFHEIQNKKSSEFEVIEILDGDIKKLLLHNNDITMIEYYSNGFEYKISIMNCDYKTAYEIANSI